MDLPVGVGPGSPIRTTPVVTWATPAPISQGTPLGPAALNATANVPGPFAYTPSAATVLPAGAGETLNVLFTPADSNNYTAASASVQIDVTAPQLISGARLMSNDSAVLVVVNIGSSTVAYVAITSATLNGAAGVPAASNTPATLPPGGSHAYLFTFPTQSGSGSFGGVAANCTTSGGNVALRTSVIMP